LFAATSYGQAFEKGKGKAVIYFESNTKVIVRLDSHLLVQTKAPFLLKEGKYVIRAWAPTKQLFVDTISILQDRTTIVARRLKNTKAYNRYKEEVVMYKFKKTVTAFIPLPLTAAYSIYMWNQYSGNKKLMDSHLVNARAAAVNYGSATSTADISKYSQEYDSEKNSYEIYRAKNNQIVKTGAIVASTALVASAALLYVSKKVKRPAAYTETPMLTLNTIAVRSDYPNSCSLGVIININR
jgi:hypothetical protein